MGEWVCQPDSFTTGSWGCELTCETIPISVANPQPQLHSAVLNIVSVYWIV